MSAPDWPWAFETIRIEFGGGVPHFPPDGDPKDDKEWLTKLYNRAVTRQYSHLKNIEHLLDPV